MSFIPKGYEMPKSSNSRYLKLVDGDNLFRILDKPILGWIDWKEENGKPSPVRTPFSDPKPEPINPKRQVKHFWAFPVWDYKTSEVKILEITQSSIQEAIYNLDCDEAWGDPVNYDISVKRSGKDLETKYFTQAKPPKPMSQDIISAYAENKPDLTELFRNGDPFSKKTQEDKEIEMATNDIDFKDIPF